LKLEITPKCKPFGVLRKTNILARDEAQNSKFSSILIHLADTSHIFRVRANQFGALFEERVKKNRFLHQSPPTLLDLSMEAMAKHWKYFDGNRSWYDPLQDELNPFRNMRKLSFFQFCEPVLF
jgi:hypothetical protein